MNYFTDLLSTSFLSAAGWTVIHSLWMGVLVLTVAIILQQLLVKNNPALKYWIAFGSQLLLAVLAVFTFLFYFLKSGQPSIGEAFFSGSTALGGNGASMLSANIKALLTQHTPTIALIWLVGVIFLSMKMAVGYRYIHQLRKNSWILEDERIQSLRQTITRHFNIDIPVEIRTTRTYITPLLTGLYRPFVILPLAVINSLEMEEVEFILAHELAHLKRYDHWAIFIQQTIETLLYFNPAIWALSRQINNYREEACDDMVINMVGKEINYAKSLVKLQELNTAQSHSKLALSALGRNNELLNRIKRIMNMENNNRYSLGRMALILLVPFALALLSFYAKHEAKKEVVELEKLETLVAHVEYTESNIAVDTVPLPKGKTKIIEKIVKKENGREIEAEFEGDQLQYLKIDGEQVDPEESEEYRVVLKELKEELDHSGRGQHHNRAFLFRGNDGNVEKYDFKFEFDENSEELNELFEGLGEGLEGLDEGLHEMFEGMEGFGEGMEELFDNFEILESEDGSIFKIDGNKIFEWHSDSEDGKFQFEFNGDNLEIQDYLEDIEINKEELMEQMEELKLQMPEIIEDEHRIIIKRLGDEDVIIDIDKLHESSEYYEKKAEKWGKEYEKKMEKYHESQEKYHEHAKRQRDAMRDNRNDFRRDYEHARDSEMNKRRFEEYAPFHSNSNRHTLQGRIEKELRRDGFMSDSKDYTFKLKENKLKINGKKQPQDVYEKYKDIYERYTGSKLEKGSTFSSDNTNI